MPGYIKAVQYAVLTAETLSFARAAMQAGVKQATLSRRITGLEDRIGFKLFSRSTRGAVPTDLGVSWLSEAKQTLANLDVLYASGSAIGAGQAGKIGIGFSTSLAAGQLRALITDFVQRFPALRIAGLEADRDKLCQALKFRSVDIAILAGGVTETNFERRPLWSERIVVVLSAKHHLAEKERVYWSDLRSERFVLAQQDPGVDLANLLKSRLCEPGFQPDVELQEVSRDNVVNMVPIGGFISLTTDTALGRTPGIVLKEVYDVAGGVARIDYAGYWRDDNQNPVLSRLLKLLGDRYPA